MPKKKPRKRSRGATPAVDVNAKRQERLEARRQAKAEALKAQRRRERRDRILRTAALVVLGAGLLWFFFLRGAGGLDAIAGHEIEDFDLSGQHVAETPTYESTPPVSGDHFADVVAECGTHAEQIDDPAQVHTLEHAAVGIQYQPDLAPRQISRIEAIVRDFDSHVFSGPYEGMESPIAVSAWGHLMRLDEVDEDAIRQFIEEFRQGGDAPEPDQECPATADESFAAAGTPTPEGSPGAGGSPDEGSPAGGDSPAGDDSPEDGGKDGGKDGSGKGEDSGGGDGSG